MDTLVRGIAIGFAIAAPVGPIGLLCITRTLTFGARIGFVSGVGAALADATYGAIAALGLSAVVLAARRFETPLHVAGALLLIGLGLRTLLSSVRATTTLVEETPSPHAAFLSTFALTAVNPSTIVSFVAIVSAARVSGRANASALFVMGIFFGSALWWAVLASAVSLAHKSITSRVRNAIRVISGLLLAAMGSLLLR